MAKKKGTFESTWFGNMLENLFEDEDLFSTIKRRYKPIPLKKRGNIEFELQWQKADLEKEGHKVIHIDQNKFGERVMIYRVFYGDDLDDVNIDLRVKVISKKGVMVPDPNIYLTFESENKHLRIADIRIEGDQVNKGYGSIMMEGLMQLAQQLDVKSITGWISYVDWDHIDRLEHFYKKFGFTCDIDHEIKHGTLVWHKQE